MVTTTREGAQEAATKPMVESGQPVEAGEGRLHQAAGVGAPCSLLLLTPVPILTSQPLLPYSTTPSCYLSLNSLALPQFPLFLLLCLPSTFLLSASSTSQSSFPSTSYPSSYSLILLPFNPFNFTLHRHTPSSTAPPPPSHYHASWSAAHTALPAPAAGRKGL